LIVEYDLLLAKQTQVRAVKNAWGRHKSDTKIHEKNEMLPATLVASLCKTHVVLCSEITDVHAMQVRDVRT